MKKSAEQIKKEVTELFKGKKVVFHVTGANYLFIQIIDRAENQWQMFDIEFDHPAAEWVFYSLRGCENDSFTKKEISFEKVKNGGLDYLNSLYNKAKSKNDRQAMVLTTALKYWLTV